MQDPSTVMLLGVTIVIRLIIGTILLAIFVAFAALVAFLLDGTHAHRNGKNWVGVRDEWMSMSRARLRTLRNTRELVAEGYRKYTKHGAGFSIPQLTSMPMFLLPVYDLEELIHVPEDRSSYMEANIFSAGVNHTLGESVIKGPHITVVRGTLTRKLTELVPVIDEELRVAMSTHWPTKEDAWSQVNILTTCTEITEQVLQRVFCGPELCRNREFIVRVQRHYTALVVSTAFLQFLPNVLRPLLAPFFRVWIKLRGIAVRRMMSPIIRKRLANLVDEGRRGLHAEGDDCIHWLLSEILKSSVSPREIRDDDVVQGLLIINVLALHTVRMSATNLLLDLFSAPEMKLWMTGLREECAKAYEACGGAWHRQGLDGLVRVDSTIKESLRFSLMSEIGQKRIITDPRGLTLRSGLHVPPGMCVGAPIASYHFDPEFYPGDPRTFDAFRFSRYREQHASEVADPDRSAQGQNNRRSKNMALTATSPEYLPFGHGKHACPGRFFASVILKLMLARLVLHYDVKARIARPHRIALTHGTLPPNQAVVSLKLRA